MSNESENRIDLTQFRLVTIGIELGLTQAALREWHTGMKRERLGEVIRAHEEVPKLIAELKKLYEFMDLHQICGCGAICRNMNKETWARVKLCGFCESAE